MAVMIPPSAPDWGPGRLAERGLWSSLAESLPDDFFVYHDLRYVGEDEPREGEIDFLVLHREEGLLAIECKGSGVRFTGNGEWLRVCTSGSEVPMAESPFSQAQRHVKELVDKLAPRVRRAFPELGGAFPFTHGHAVAFPRQEVERPYLPLDAPRAIVIDRRDLGRLGERIPEILSFWGRGRPPHPVLDDRQFRRFRRDLLLPRLRLAPSLGGSLELDRRAIVRLSAEQVETLRSVVRGPRLAVRGGAGTGKTLLAMEAAHELAMEGKSVLLTCFNVALARHLERTTAARQTLGTVRVATFHELCRQAAEILGEVPPEPPPADRAAGERHWNEELPDRLLKGLVDARLPRYDAVIADEGQDFLPAWWPLLEWCLDEPTRGTVVVFHDPNQAIFRDACRVPPWPEIVMGVNFRNSRRIAAHLQGILDGAAVPCSRAPEGEEPGIHPQAGGKAGQRQVIRLVEELLERGADPEQVVILTPHRKENSVMGGVESVAGVPLSTDPDDRAGAVLCATIGRFKGLESDAVVLADVDERDLFCGPAFRYTAASRARSLLHVFVKR